MCEKRLKEIAETYGFEIKKELKYSCGYCYKYYLVNEKDNIYAGEAGPLERCFLSEEELIKRIQNGRPQEEIERAELLREYAEAIEKEMLS